MQQDHRGVELEQSNSNKNEMKGVQQELLGQHKRKKRRIEKWAGMMEVMTQKKLSSGITAAKLTMGQKTSPLVSCSLSIMDRELTTRGFVVPEICLEQCLNQRCLHTKISG